MPEHLGDRVRRTSVRVAGTLSACAGGTGEAVDWWDEVRLALQAFLDHHGVLSGFVLVLVEGAGVPVPVPGDFLMLALGAAQATP